MNLRTKELATLLERKNGEWPPLVETQKESTYSPPISRSELFITANCRVRIVCTPVRAIVNLPNFLLVAPAKVSAIDRGELSTRATGDRCDGDDTAIACS